MDTRRGGSAGAGDGETAGAGAGVAEAVGGAPADRARRSRCCRA